MTALYYILLTLFLALSCFLILLVLIQKGRGGGLSSAFGGVGGNTAFGAKTGDVLTWATSIVFGVFLLLAIGLNLLANNIHAKNSQLVVPTTTAPAPIAPPVSNESMPMPVPEPAAPPATAPSAVGTVIEKTTGAQPATQPTVTPVSPVTVQEVGKGFVAPTTQK